MRSMSRFSFVMILGLFLIVPAMAGEDSRSLRLVENLAPGANLQQAAAADTELAAELNSIRNEIKKSGELRIAVRTAVPFAPESLLGEWEKTVQRRDIARAAASLRKAMPKAKRFEPLPDVPYVLLTVDEAGLARLQSVPGIVRITPEASLNWMHDFVELDRARRDDATLTRSKSSGLRIEPRIVGGTKADPSTHPFQVALVNKRTALTSKAQFCGGTLVSPYHVVTAAHCTFTRNPTREVQVLVGTQSLDQGGQRVDVWRVTKHPSYNRRTEDYDVAIWELATPVTGIPFATITNTQPTTAGTPLRVTGWGTLEYRGNSTPDLQQVDVPYVPSFGDSCGDYWGDITSRMLCAGSGGKDSCQGDSGGPLTIDRGAGFTELVGIVSFGNGCGIPGYPGVYANVAESGINRFIRSFVDAPFVPRTIEFQSSAYTVDEGARRVTLTVTRTQPAGPATVVLKTETGTAGKPDFRALSRTLTFKPGVASVSVPISIVNDRLVEGTESFTVRLSSPAIGFPLGANSTATVSIIDNDMQALSAIK